MSLNIPPSYYEVAFHHTQFGQTHDCVCTMGVHSGASNPAAQYDELAKGWAFIAEGMTNDWTFTHTTIRNAIGTVYDSTIHSQQGQSSQITQSANNTYVLKKLTSRPGRAGRGRMFVPGVGDTEVDQHGHVADSKISELQGKLNAATQAWAGGQWALTLLHTQGIRGGDDPTPLTSIEWSHYIGVQRRRLQRAG